MQAPYAGRVNCKTRLENNETLARLPSMKPFEEIVSFIADAAGADKLSAFRPSPAAEQRVAELLVKQKEGKGSWSPATQSCGLTMSASVPARLRRLVTERAGGICEYCLIHQDDAHFTFQVDHIVS
eukprot:gene17025-20825_t